MDWRGIQDQVVKKAFDHPSVKKGQYTFWENVQAFYHAINWTEPLLVGILAFHIVIALTVIATRRRHNLQIALFVAICATVYCAEYINTYCRNNWQSLATQNYFDTNGIFVSTVFSAPLLLLILFQMLYALVTSMRLLIKVKRAELIANSKQQSKEKGAQGGPTEGEGERAAGGAAAPSSSKGKARRRKQTGSRNS